MNPLITVFQLNTRIIVGLLGLTLIVPSCTIYKIKPSTIEQAANYNNRPIKVNATNGNVIKLRWIEEKNDTIISIKDTKRVVIETNKIVRIKAGQLFISLDSAKNHDGKIQIISKNRDYTFLSLQVKDDLVIGVEKIGKEIIPVVIPKHQIRQIKVKNKGLSIAGTIGTGIVLFYIIPITASIFSN